MSKPYSLPDHWPNPSQNDLISKPNRYITIGKVQNYIFNNNFINTAKYEFYNAIPKILLEEFNPYLKIANCYFLMIACLQLIKPISNTNGYPTVLIPLSMMLIISGVFKIVEDIERHKADKKANSSFTQIYDTNTKEFKAKMWSEVIVGDYIKIKSREIIPADIILLYVSEPNPVIPKGVCYVETKSLDGETNLKIRSVVPALIGKIKDFNDLSLFEGFIQMEHPNNLIDSFTGILETPILDGLDKKTAINPGNVVLRGCVVRSTEWIVGIVVNTGHDVKIMQSNTKARIKASNLDELATTEIFYVVIMLVLLCFTGATGQSIFISKHSLQDHWYLDLDSNNFSMWIIQFFYEFLIHASLVPVALYVSMGIVRFAQSKFMCQDLSMYYQPLDAPAQVRTMTLNEELGQISHIFSDKTGTLTCNIMNYRKSSINGVVYGQGITEIGRAAWKLLGKPVPPEVESAEKQAAQLAVPHVAFYDPSFYIDYEQQVDHRTKDESIETIKRSPIPGQKKYIEEFYRYIAVCHEVVPERLENGSIKLSAPNSDDEALVCAAAFFGYSFQDRRDKFCLVHETSSNRTLEIEILYTIPFTSTRKRMSVIIRDIDGKIKLITKGADSMMFTRVDTSDVKLKTKTEADIDQFSLEGLRCLVLAMKEINNDSFLDWKKLYDEANISLLELEKRKRGESNVIEQLEDFIEQNLHIIGATAIEDRLQNGVPDCIEKLIQAGIKIWVLTGDKEETAINIAVACNLVLPKEYMDQVIINKYTVQNLEDAKKIFKEGLQKNEEMSSKKKPCALIIDGPSLIFILADLDTKLLLLKFSQTCKAVVCCRVSPDQKREVVDMIKNGVPGVRTLAIGDGANDVAMIMAAHIGVGIKGEEGVQAVNASDFSIAQFKYLKYLLLKHGRYNYIRMCNLVCYIFYKNVLCSISMFWFNFLCAFSGRKIYTEAAIQFYNLFYTSLPILLYSAYDKDVTVRDCLRFPQLYTAGIKNHYFNHTIFWGWVIEGIIESVLLSILPFYYMITFDNETGNQTTYYQASSVCFLNILIIVNLKMFRIMNEVHMVILLLMLIGVLIWILFAYIVDYSVSIDYDFHGTWSRELSCGVFWLVLLLQLVMILLKDISISSIRRTYFYTPADILHEMDSYKIKYSSDTDKTMNNNSLKDKYNKFDISCKSNNSDLYENNEIENNNNNNPNIYVNYIYSNISKCFQSKSNTNNNIYPVEG